jgi:KDO2-lipid IV(A) lauroyltransferase
VRRWLVELQHLLEYLLLWPVVAMVRRLSEERSRALARGLGRVLYRLLAHDRRWCLKNLELVFGPNLTPSQRTRLAIQAFEHTVLTRFEAIRCTPEWLAAHVLEEGYEATREIIREASLRGKGVIVVSAHLGNFELIPAWCGLTGCPARVMYRPQDNRRVERLLLASRQYQGWDAVPRDLCGLLALRSALRQAKTIGLMIDINTLRRPVFVDFLGFQAASPPGPAALALKTGAVVLLAITFRQPDGRHRIIFHPPFARIQTGDRDRDLEANTQQYMRAIEPYVLAHAEQYNWLHPRWRFRPDGSFWTNDMPYARLSQERSGPPRRRGGLLAA